MPDTTDAQQNSYLALIDHQALKAYIQNLRRQSDWSLKTRAAHENHPLSNTENRLKALNTALLIPYTEPEFVNLLEQVRICIGLGQLNANRLEHMLAENAASVAAIDNNQKVRIVDLFRVIYLALREVDGLLSSNFWEQVQKQETIALNQHRLIEAHVKEGIMATNGKQRRSVDAWYLLQDVLWGRYRSVSALAAAIFNVSKSPARRASESVAMKEDERLLAIHPIEKALSPSAAIIQPWLANRQLSQTLVTPMAASSAEVKLRTEAAATVNLHHYAAWQNGGAILAIGDKVLLAVKEAVGEWLNKSEHKAKLGQWLEKALSALHAYLDRNKLKHSGALGLYFFAKSLPIDYQPSSQLLQALAQVTAKDVTEVPTYLASFMPHQQARHAHADLVAAQLGLNRVLPLAIAGEEAQEAIGKLLNAFMQLVVFVQTPLAVLTTAKQLEDSMARLGGLLFPASSIHDELDLRAQALYQGFAKVQGLKKNLDYQQKIGVLVKDTQGEMQRLTADLHTGELKAQIDQLQAEKTSLNRTVETQKNELKRLREEVDKHKEALKRFKATIPAPSFNQAYASQNKPGDMEMALGQPGGVPLPTRDRR